MSNIGNRVIELSEDKDLEEINDSDLYPLKGSIVTKHAEKRVRKRLGLSKSTVPRAFELAVAKGKHVSDFSGAFKRYLDMKSIEYKATPYVYNNFIYWTMGGGSRLITVYRVPNAFRKYL